MSVNKLTLIGNVGDEPRVKQYEDGSKCAVLRLATTDRAYTRQDGQQVPERTEWHTLVFWRRLAETVQQYVHKGDKLYIEGKLKSREYADKNYPDVKHKAVDVEVSFMEMLTSKLQGAVPVQPAPVPLQPATPEPQPQFTYQHAQAAVQASQQYMKGMQPAQPRQPVAPPPVEVQDDGELPF